MVLIEVFIPQLLTVENLKIISITLMSLYFQHEVWKIHIYVQFKSYEFRNQLLKLKSS